MPVASERFVDTNVLLYAVSSAAEEREKTRIARDLLQGHVAFSFQVLQEFYAVAINPRKLGLTRKEAASYCLMWMEFPLVPLTGETFVGVLELVRAYRISNWDAGIVAAAMQMGCRTLYSEDLGHGQRYGGVTVVNPFREV